MFKLQESFIRITLKLSTIVRYSSGTSILNTFEFKTNFTSEEQTKVLNILNDSNQEQLSRFRISQNRIKNLVNWKYTKGPFRSLNEVLEVEGLGERVLEKICEKIIKENLDNSDKNVGSTLQQTNHNVKNNRKIKQLLNPPLPANIVNRLQSAVGIHLGPMGVSWVKLCRNKNKLVDWNFENFNFLPMKMSPTDTFNLAMNILRKIPTGEVYILEANATMSPQTQSQSATIISSYNQQLELTAMLIALLNTSVYHNASLQAETKGTHVENRVFQLRSKIPARLFRTLVGSEKVAAIKSVSELVNGENSADFTLPCTPITLDEEIKTSFQAQFSANKELLGQALMLTVAFMDLCVYKNQKSYAALAPGRNKNNDGKLTSF